MHNKIWSNCLKVIKDNVPGISFKTWFEPIVPLRLKDNILTIQVPSPFFYEYIEEQFIDLISKALRKEIGHEAKLEYSVLVENAPHAEKPATINYPTANQQKMKNKPVNMPFSEEMQIKNPFVIPGIQKLNIDPMLNPQYSFDNFIEGECNRLARSAGIAVADSPGSNPFNPLFVYGESGLGKSHLIQAIGIRTKEKHPDKIVLYVSANKFQTQYTDAVRTGNVNDFLNFYQMIDVLVIDDIQEFQNKLKTQDTFFHIFNHLQQNNKQLILSSDKSPVELQGLEQRLLSRFKWGLSAELHTPDFQTRLSILKHKVYTDGINISEDVLQYVAMHITSNIRELEGALVNLLAQSTFNKKEITLDLAKIMIDKVIKNSKKQISIDYIQKIVCNYLNVPVDMIHTKTRKREIVQARQIAMYFAKQLTKESLSNIGSQIGSKDHATVLHACRTVNNLIETDKKFKNQIDDIEKKLKF